MKQLYRVLPMVLSVGLFGCGNSTPQENTSSTGAVSTENKDKFVSKLSDSAPVLKVAMIGTLPPFSFQDDYGNMQGTEVDSIRAIGEEQGFKVEFYKETWQGMFDRVESGERDLGISGISYKDDRAEKYGLSIPYAFNPSAMMYAKDDLNIKVLEDIKGLRVGTLEGAKQEELLKEMGDSVELISRPTIFLAYEDLMQDKTDVVLYDLPILLYTARMHPEYNVNVVSYENQDTPSAQQVILMAKGNTVLIDKVNEGITKLKERDVFKEIDDRWLGVTNMPSRSASNTIQQAN